MSQKRYYPTALALYITYFVLGISSSVMGHYKQEFAALWGAVPGADGMYDIPSVVAVIAAIGLGRRRSRPILNRSAVSTRSTQPSRYNRHSKSPGDSASMRNLRGIVSFTFNYSPHGARRGCSYRVRGMYSHSVIPRLLPTPPRSR